MVNGPGPISLAGRQLNVGYELAGQCVTLRMDGTQMTVIRVPSIRDVLLRTLPALSDQETASGSAEPAAHPWPACHRLIAALVDRLAAVIGWLRCPR